MEIRRSYDRLISTMVFPILVRQHLYIESGPRSSSYRLPRCHGPLTRYVKLQVAHAPGMPGTFSPAADFKENRLLAIPACITARAWRTCRDACRDRLHAVTGKTFPAFPAHAHPQFYVSGKRPIGAIILKDMGEISWHLTTTKHSREPCVCAGDISMA